jgi:hypothetical protein
MTLIKIEIRSECTNLRMFRFSYSNYHFVYLFLGDKCKNQVYFNLNYFLKIKFSFFNSSAFSKTYVNLLIKSTFIYDII